MLPLLAHRGVGFEEYGPEPAKSSNISGRHTNLCTRSISIAPKNNTVLEFEQSLKDVIS